MSRRSNLVLAAIAGAGTVLLFSGIALASGAVQLGPAAAPTSAFAAGKVVAASAIGISVAELRKELPGKSLAQIAQAHGVPRDTLVQKLVVALDADIDKALADKTITQDQADKLKTNVPARVASGVDRVFPQSKGVGARAPRVAEFARDIATDAAKAIGTAQLKRELPGKTVAQVAQAHGVSRDSLIQALITDAAGRIDSAAGSGRITADQAAKLKTMVAAAVARLVDRTFPSR